MHCLLMTVAFLASGLQGVEPSIRSQVWEFLLGVYDPDSTAAERDGQRQARREMYENLKVQYSVLSS